MIETQKDLSLKEIKNQIWELKNKLDFYLTQKKINFTKTQAGAIQYKDVISSSNSIFDKYTHYVIKDEEYDNTIYSLQESLASYEQLLVKEMKRMSKYDEVGLICYLREEEHKSWKQIDKLLHRGEDYSRTKYKRYKLDENIN